MTHPNLSAWNALDAKRTQGEWYWSSVYKTTGLEKTWSLIGDRGYGILSCDGVANSPQGLGDDANAGLIAAVPAILAALNAEVLAHQKSVAREERLRKAVLLAARWFELSANELPCPTAATFEDLNSMCNEMKQALGAETPGFKIVLDESLPPDVAVFKDSTGKIIGKIEP